ncbi:hypothetical protein [Roseovarius sp. MBR-6]|uniref:hypothetical protein n=1 Tax=Roseovarius sp. MBR-6 TaxID=3156459 RepID=UPI00339A608E
MTVLMISNDMNDADLAKAMDKALRAGDALIMDGAVGRALQTGAQAWIGTLARARSPVTVTLSGEVGPRGLALALLADAVTLSNASAQEAAHRVPLLAVLAATRLGQVAARAFLAEPAPLRALKRAGVLHGAKADVVAAHKTALVAAAELPFEEAVSFAALIHLNQEQN